MEQNEAACNAIIKNALAKELEKINEKINGLGEYYATSANLLLGLCDAFEGLFDDLISVNQRNHNFLAFSYGDGIRRECEWATKCPDKKENYSSIKEYYNCGKRHLQQIVKLLIFQLKNENVK
jgi:hypothetical protein